MVQGDEINSVGGENGTAATQAALLGMPHKRRTPAEMEALRSEIATVLTDDHPQTCRSVFYRLVSRRAVPKTEAAYQGIVVRLLTRMRLDGAIPFTWITDGTRLRRKPNFTPQAESGGNWRACTVTRGLALSRHRTQPGWAICWTCCGSVLKPASWNADWKPWN